MDIITQNPDFARIAFAFNAQNAKINQIPSPTAFWLLGGSKSGFLVAYDLWGDFTHKKPALYINDVILRYAQTYNCEPVSAPATTPAQDNGRRYDLGEIAKGLESLKRRAATFPETKRVYTGKEDALFWTAKEFCEMTIRRGDSFTEFDLRQVILLAGGTYSEAKAKAKAIYAWYAKRGFKGSARVFEMSRSEHMKKVNEERKNKAKAAVLSVVTSMRFLGEKVTSGTVAKTAQVGRTTAAKYLKELKEEGLI